MTCASSIQQARCAQQESAQAPSARRVTPGKPHDVMPYALRALVEQIGMTPRQALRAATTIAASAIGLGESKGRIAAGADADVLAVRGDPVADIGAITNVQAVYRAGLKAR